MLERILFIPGTSPTELLRTLASHGVNTLGLRVMGATEFARTALMRSGVAVPQEYLARKDEAAVIDTFIRDVSYFKSASLADAENMASALFALRSLITEREEETIRGRFTEGEFPAKNRAIAEVYNRYRIALSERNLIDSVGLVRKALESAKPFTCEAVTVEEFPLSPLEEALAEACSTTRTKTKLAELFGISGQTKIQGLSYLESYGSANEVEAILNDIASKGYPYDRCTVAVAATSAYAQLFYEYSLTHGIDITFGCGIPITDSYPARLLRALASWDTDGYHGPDALQAVIGGEAVNRAALSKAIGVETRDDLMTVAMILGNLKCNCDFEQTKKKLNNLKPVLEARVASFEGRRKNHAYYDSATKLRLLDAAEKLGAELAAGFSSFIRRFALIRKDVSGRIDKAAINVICDSIDAYVEYSGRTDIVDLIPEILGKTVCSEPSREGALHVTGIGGAFASLRDKLYIAGLSANNYPGKPTENYILLDSDYEMFGENLPTSANRITAKKAQLKDLIRLACGLKVPVQLSFSGYNAAEMSTANPSSVLFELYQEEHGEDASTDDFNKGLLHTGYFCQDIARSDSVGRAYVEGKDLLPTEVKPEEESFRVGLSEKGYSPSTLEGFYACPRKYFLENVIGIEDPEEVDPFTVIDAKQVGSLAHSVMEWLAGQPNRPSKEELLQRAEEMFADHLKEYAPLNEYEAEREKKTFRKMMSEAYDRDPANEVESAEEKKTVLHESGITLTGYPDRVEKNPDGQYLIADFKTGRRVKHSENDIDSCLQVVIYAYMMDKLGMPISFGEYRYLRRGVTVPCAFDDDMKQQLSDRLEAFRKSLEDGDFPAFPSDDNCRYCTFADICQSKEETGGVEDEQD